MYEILHKNDDKYSVLSDFSWDILQDKDGTIYLGTLNGISFTNLRNNFFSIHTLPDSLHHYTEYFTKLILGTDHQNNIWLAPNWKYLLKYNDLSENSFVPGGTKLKLNAITSKQQSVAIKDTTVVSIYKATVITGKIHEVQPKEGLYTIAKNYQVSVQQ